MEVKRLPEEIKQYILTIKTFTANKAKRCGCDYDEYCSYWIDQCSTCTDFIWNCGMWKNSGFTECAECDDHICEPCQLKFGGFEHAWCYDCVVTEIVKKGFGKFKNKKFVENILD